MKAVYVTLFLIAMISKAQAAVGERPPHFDLQMGGEEWSRVFEAHPEMAKASGRLAAAMALGKRNLDWLKHINSRRADKISLTDPESLKGGIPIDKPKEYNESIVYRAYLDLLPLIPGPMRRVLVDGEPFSDEPGLPVKDYIAWGLKIDRLYGNAARWISMVPYLDALKMYRAKDVRGFYFLSRDPDRDSKLKQFDALESAEQVRYRGWLIMMCLNNGLSQSNCANELRTAETNATLPGFYAKYLSRSKTNWESFFRLRTSNPHVSWPRSSPDLAKVSFVRDTQPIMEFLRVNLEDEWRWGPWRLEVDFGPNAGVQVIWQPGITPHVPALGASTMYMDANAPLTEYDVQWTIRHEFGHVLGLPDCYLEFFDESRGVIVSYQFDVSDMMCSRAGKFKEGHFRELKRVYH